MPPGSGVPVPGANAGSSTSTSTERQGRALAGHLDRLVDHGLNAAVANGSMHEQRGDALLVLPAELIDAQ